ncbi:MAG: nucleoside hydrolase [bacterium]
MSNKKPIPVILDTDIGPDIDDTWALAMMLNCPELDVKLVVSDEGDTLYRAKIIARVLEIAGRSDVAVGVGVRQPCPKKQMLQSEWVKGYNLRRYPGKVWRDGVEGIIRTILDSPEPVTIVCIGPMPNIGEALRREPRIVRNARFVGMHGSIAWSHSEDHKVVPEYNVAKDVAACQAFFRARWIDKTITPLDTCARVRLQDRKYAKVAQSKQVLPRAVIENYRIWQRQGGWVKEQNASSILFDCVAVHLAYSTRFLKMRRMGVRVTNDGFTVRDPKAGKINVALAWKDLPGFEDDLVKRLTAKQVLDCSDKRCIASLS